MKLFRSKRVEEILLQEDKDQTNETLPVCLPVVFH